MSHSVGQLVDRCINVWLLGTFSAQFNQLAMALSDTATEVSLSLPLGEISAGSFVSIDDELMYVVERDTTNRRIIVARGVRGTTNAAHALAASVEINPRFPRWLIRQVMSEELDSWPETLYAVQHFTATVAARTGVIAVPAQINGLTTRHTVRVRRQSLSVLDSRFRRTDGYESQWDLNDNGSQIALDVSLDVATSFQVTVACDFLSVMVEAGDDVVLEDQVGLSPGMCEILELGACHRLLTGRASVRLFPEAEGQSRSAAEVSARDIPVLANSLMALKERAITREATRLVRRYGFGGN